MKDVARLKIEYAAAHPDSDLSAYYLCFCEDPDDAIEYAERLTERVRNGVFKTALNNSLSFLRLENERKVNAERLVVGVKAPDFTLKTVTGEDFTLSSLPGKYVVLDFWGSWCGWCIKGLPRMKEYYTKYRDRLEIVGIACCDTPEKAAAVISEYGLEWIQTVNGTNGVTDDVSIVYGIAGYPTKIILDSDMTIVAVVRGESPEFYEVLDALMKRI